MSSQSSHWSLFFLEPHKSKQCEPLSMTWIQCNKRHFHCLLVQIGLLILTNTTSRVSHSTQLSSFFFSKLPISTDPSLRQRRLSAEFSFNEQSHNNSLSVCSGRRWGEVRRGGGAGGWETVMINHHRGLCEADSITSLDCSTVGKVRLSIGGLQLPLSLQERQN